jgi:hypothetical protein
MTNTTNETNEIDLLELFRIIGNSIKSFLLSVFKGLIFLFFFGIKKVHWILLAVILGLVMGNIMFSISPRYYSSDLIAQPNGIPATDMVEYINELEKFASSGNPEALAISLNISDSIAENIISIKAFHYLDVNKDDMPDLVDLENEYNPRDTTVRIFQNRFFVQVNVLDYKIFNHVKTGLNSYIETNDYLTRLNRIRKNELNELISFSENEINKLDSLQNVDYFEKDENFSSANENRLIFLSETDKKMYYLDKQRLVQQKQRFEKELEMSTEPITIIKDFTPLTVEENPRGGYLLKFGSLLGILGYLGLLVFYYRKNIQSLLL